MIALKKIGLAVLMMFLFIGCTEIYVPDISTSTEALVVEGKLSNGDGPFTVKLTKALLYSADSSARSSYIPDAKVTLLDNEMSVFNYVYTGYGVYELQANFKAVIGKTYKLKIELRGGHIYESTEQTLLKPLGYDSIYTSFITKNRNILNDQSKITCFDIRANLVSNTFSKFRFESNVVTQYNYNYRLNVDPKTDSLPSWGWNVHGWKKFEMDNQETIINLEDFSTNKVYENFPVCMIPFGFQNYSLGIPEYAEKTYYYRLKQFTINDETYRFYKAANGQLAASGKLFDPVTSQLYGNIKCISNPKRMVLGLFEVSSVKTSAFVLEGYPEIGNGKLRQVPFVTISPNEAVFKYKNSIFPDSTIDTTNDPDYVVIPFPEWWLHN